MLGLINEKMKNIYDDFENELEREEVFCKLHGFSFQNDMIPNYSDGLQQNLYLLRYLPAYFVEYYKLYKRVLRSNFIEENLNILSIGCGCGVDLWSLKLAKERMLNDIGIDYWGIDIIDWRYKSIFEESRYTIEDIINIDDIKDRNLIIFPKSIGEFGREDFEKIKEKIGNCNFISNNIILCGSFRKTRADFDMDRVMQIVQSMKRYRIVDEKEDLKCYSMPKKENGYDYRIQDILPNFKYPEKIKLKFNDINKKCKEYNIIEDKGCSSECDDKFKRLLNPVTTLSQLRYCVIRLERR